MDSFPSYPEIPATSYKILATNKKPCIFSNISLNLAQKTS
jgi:hypothetical protein